MSLGFVFGSRCKDLPQLIQPFRFVLCGEELGGIVGGVEDCIERCFVQFDGHIIRWRRCIGICRNFAMWHCKLSVIRHALVVSDTLLREVRVVLLLLFEERLELRIGR